MKILAIFAVIVLIILSSIFSGSETAFFSITEIKRRKLLRSPIKNNRLTGQLLEKPRSLLLTILTGNMLVNITLSTINDNLLGHNIFLSVFVTIVFLLLFGEVTPKTVAVQKRESFAHVFSPFFKYVSILLYPISKSLEVVSSIILPQDTSRIVGEAEMKSAIEESAEFKLISKRITALTKNTLEMDKADIALIAVPISGFRIFLISENPDMAFLFRHELELQAIVIIGENETEILSVFTRREYLSGRGGSNFVIVHESTSILSGYTRLVEKGGDVLVLIDEHARITGIVPGQDILSVVFTPPEKQDRTSSVVMGKFIVFSGDTLLKDIESTYEFMIPRKRSRTLSGAITDSLGRIPKKGEIIEIGNFEIRIIDATPKCIDRIAVKRLRT